MKSLSRPVPHNAPSKLPISAPCCPNFPPHLSCSISSPANSTASVRPLQSTVQGYWPQVLIEGKGNHQATAARGGLRRREIAEATRLEPSSHSSPRRQLSVSR